MWWRRFAPPALTAAALALSGLGSQALAAPAPSVRVLSISRMPGSSVRQVLYTSGGLSLEALIAPGSSGTAAGRPILLLLGPADLYPQPVTHVRGAVYSPTVVAKWASWYPQAVVVAPDYQGYAASGGTAGTPADDVADARAAIRVAVRDFDGSPDRVYVVGRQVGADVSLMLPERVAGVRAIADVSPYTSYVVNWAWAQSVLGTPGSSVQNLVDAEWVTTTEWAFFSATPSQKPAAYAAQSPSLAVLARDRTPVLLVDGTGDTAMPWQNARRFANELSAAGGNVRLVIYHGGAVGLLTGSYWPRSMAQVAAWFKRYGLVRA